MTNIYLARPDLSDAASVTGSTALGDMSLQNVQKKSLSRVYRTSDLSATIAIDLGAAQEIDFCSIVAHNATASGTVTIKAGSTDAVSDYTSGALDLITGNDLGYELNSFAASFTAQTYRYWQLEFSDASNPDSYLQIGRVYLSKAFTPTTNIDYGVEEGFSDQSRVSRTISSEVISVDRDPFRVATFEMSFLSQDEAFTSLYEFDRLRGKKKDVVFVPDMSETTHFQRRFIYGIFNEMNPIVNRAFRLYRKRYRIEEVK